MKDKPILMRLKKAANYIYVLLGALVLFMPALLNGYPILNNDDATYLWAGFTPTTPIDRPIAYGIFLRIFSFNGVTLFTCAFAQCWLMSWLLHRVFKRVVTGDKYNLYALAATIILAGSSSLSWISSEILPDFLTPVALLALALILLQQETRSTTALLFFIYAACISTHMSHVSIYTLVLLITLLFRKKLFAQEQLRIATQRIGLALFLTLGCIFTMGYAIANSKHVFGMGAILEQGILKPYLDETCPTEHYRICDYKDNLIENANYFLWVPESPIFKTGGWEANKDEYNKILKGTYTSPKYLAMRIKMSFVVTWRQLLDFRIGDGNYPVDLLNRVRQYVPGDERAFRAAVQHQDQLLPLLPLPNKIIITTVIISLVVLLAQLFLLKNSNKAFTLFVFLAVTATAVNIWACATMGQVNGRYGCRVMWLIPLCALIGLAQQFSARKEAVAQ